MENENFSTPRTDAMVTAFPYTLGSTALIPTSFTRQLERETAALSAALARSEEALTKQVEVTQSWVDENGDLNNRLERSENRVKELEVSGFKVLGQIRAAWEAGFRTCRSYGDNHAHFAGEQKERLWAKYLELINADEKLAATRENATLAALADKLARSERELLTMTSDRNGVKLINEQHRATIADLTSRLATAEAARRDEESWWKEKHDYQARAESAEAALATATAQLKEVEAHAQNMEWSEQKAQTAESALTAATARCGELEGLAVEWEKQAAFIEGPSKTIFGTPIESISGYDAGVAHTYRDCAKAIRAAARPDAPLPSAGAAKPNLS